VRYLLTVAGLLSLGLGILGVFLPLLPTTPFILLAAACFYRSSPRLHAWLLGNPYFGKHIVAYRVHRAVYRKTKIMALVTLWVTVLTSVFFVLSITWLKFALVLVAAMVSFHISRLRVMVMS
jgi:uncharacterized membrane protein YbaN (DUF454 family)